MIVHRGVIYQDITCLDLSGNDCAVM